MSKALFNLDDMPIITRKRAWETRAHDTRRAFWCGVLMGTIPAFIMLVFMFALSGH